MNEEKRLEIIKAIAYGMSADEIANCEDVTVAEVEQINRNCTQEIADKKAWIERRYDYS